jgi:hypothetical protein
MNDVNRQCLSENALAIESYPRGLEHH